MGNATRFDVSLNVDPADAVRFCDALMGGLLAAEHELLELKIRDTVLQAGWHPDSEPGASLVEDMYGYLDAECMVGTYRPVETVWELAALRGVAPDWVPVTVGEDGAA